MAPTVPICAGCNVRPPFEHRCHGHGCPCPQCVCEVCGQREGFRVAERNGKEVWICEECFTSITPEVPHVG